MQLVHAKRMLWRSVVVRKRFAALPNLTGSRKCHSLKDYGSLSGTSDFTGGEMMLYYIDKLHYLFSGVDICCMFFFFIAA